MSVHPQSVRLSIIFSSQELCPLSTSLSSRFHSEVKFLLSSPRGEGPRVEHKIIKKMRFRPFRHFKLGFFFLAHPYVSVL